LSQFSKYEAVIFDMDGVLVDTEPVILEAAIQGLKDFGVSALAEDFIPFVGRGEDKFIGGVAEKYGVAFRPEMKTRVYEIYMQLVKTMLKTNKGAKECLDWLAQKQVPIALASSADFIKIKANLEVAGIAMDIFTAIVSADDVEKKKPAPDIFLKAAHALKIAPEKCIVVEDAPAGVQAANAADMYSIAVTTTFQKKQLEVDKPNLVCDDLFAVQSALKELI